MHVCGKEDISPFKIEAVFGKRLSFVQRQFEYPCSVFCIMKCRVKSTYPPNL